MGWNYGLDENPHRARQFYTVIAAASLLGMAINFLQINPIQALFWVSVISGFLAPPLLVVIMLVANNRKIMGNRVNSRLVNILGWVDDRDHVRRRHGDGRRVADRRGKLSRAKACILK